MTENNIEFITATVITVNKDLYTLTLEDEQVLARVSGKFKYIINYRDEYPCVGDKVIVTKEYDSYIIHKVCPRRTELARVSTDGTGSKQLFCANIDIVLICMSLNNDFNLKKLSQFISLGYTSQAKTAVLLTKSDLTTDVQSYLDMVHSLNTGVATFAISSHNSEDIETVKYLIANQTAVFIGASGVGKSTLINAITGENIETQIVRESDAQGRHTTTNRQMYSIPEINSYIIDTPGIRTISSYGTCDLEEHYQDIFKLADGCKYRDCNHTHEPDCKVLEALDNNEISIERYNEYFKALKVDAYYKRKERRRLRR